MKSNPSKFSNFKIVSWIICKFDQVSDWEGTEMDLAADETSRRSIFPQGGILATNGKLHDQIVQLISDQAAVV